MIRVLAIVETASGALLAAAVMDAGGQHRPERAMLSAAAWLSFGALSALVGELFSALGVGSPAWRAGVVATALGVCIIAAQAEAFGADGPVDGPRILLSVAVILAAWMRPLSRTEHR